MLDALYQDGTTKVLDDMQARPGRAPDVQPGFWGGVATAAPKGVASGALKVGATQGNILKAFGTVVGAFDPFGASIINRTDPERVKQERADALKRIESNQLLQSDVADELRRMASRMKPDAQTVGFAGQAVFGVTDFVTQAAGNYMMGGPLAAAGGTALSEGGATYDELRGKGVDQATAAKVAAVRGVASAATVALPVAGATWAGTAGLIAAGGPGTYIAENLAAREILKAADYTKLAEQYDPFDPLGLTVATGAAALFGVGARVLGKAKPAPEQVDAAHVIVAREVADQQTLAKPGDLVADGADRMARERAETQMAAGERVDVADVAPVRPDEPLPPQVEKMVTDMRAALDEVVRNDQGILDGSPRRDTAAASPERAPAMADPAFTARGESLNRGPLAQDAGAATGAEPAQIGNASVLRNLAADAGWAERGGQMLRADGMDQLSEVVGRTKWVGSEWFGEMRRALESNGVASEKAIAAAVEKYLAGDKLKANERRTVKWMVDYINRMDAETQSPALTRAMMDKGLGVADVPDAAMVARAAVIDEGRVERLAMQYADDDAAFMAGIRAIVGDENGRQATTDQPRAGTGAGSEGSAAKPADTAAARAEADPTVTAAQQVDAKMEIELPDGTRTTAGEAIRLAQEQARIEIEESSLLQVAAGCALTV